MFSISSFRRCRDALLVLAIGLFGFANAGGPVSVGSVPGGGNVVSDSDSGNGQAWGRGTGRSIQYHVNNPAGFTLLKFGIVNATVPSLAFDGTVTPQTGELMGYSAGASNLAGGIVVFTGSASIQLVNGTFTTPTRFTMRVTRASNNSPVALAFDANGVSPGADALGGDIVVNELFEFLNNPAWGGNNAYGPALDLYDALATPPGSPPSSNTGPVMTGVTAGFYYTEVVQGESIEELDAHMVSLFGGLTDTKTRIQFIAEDWPLRWNGIQGQVQDVSTALNNDIKPTLQQVQSQLTQLVGGLGGNSNAGLATKQDTDQIFNKVDSVNQILMLIMGFGCPQGAPPGFCASFKNLPQIGVDINSILIGLNNANSAIGTANTKLDANAAKLNTLATQTSVDGILVGLNQPNWLPAVQSQLNALSAKVDALQGALDSVGSSQLDMIIGPVDAGSKQARFIVKISRDGELVPAVITGVSTIRTAKSAGAYANVMGNTTIVTLAPGLYDVTINLVKDVSDGSLYVFQASAGSGAATLFGNAMAAPFK